MKPETATETGRGVQLDRNVEVFPDAPLPWLDSPNAKAYAARDRRSPDRPMFALLCPRNLGGRLDMVRGLARLEGVAMLRPVLSGVVEWPLDGREHALVAFDQPGGPRIELAGPGGPPPLREDELIRNVIPAMANLLRELKGRMVIHRAIRASNLFYANADRTGVVLGECVTEPPAFSQPMVYETVESGMATPSGRGSGYPSDDVYAFGVLLLTLLGGCEPCRGMSDEEIINSKVRNGSYVTLARDVRVSLSLMEPLRGLLCDSPAHRWSAEGLMQWAAGQRLTTKPHAAPRKMARPFEFNGQEYWHANTLSHAFGVHWDLAAKSQPAEPVIDWVRKAYGDSAVRNEFADTARDMVTLASKGADAGDRALSSLLAVLDPSAPMRYRSFSALPEAMGQVLAVEWNDQAKVEDFAAAMRARVPSTWLEMQPVVKPEFVPLKKAIEMAHLCIEQQGWGYGLERCLYELNPGWPCQSPLLDRYLVTRVEHLIPALERMARGGASEQLPVDAHIVGFCAAQMKDLPKQVLVDLGEPPGNPAHRLGALAMLAMAQEAGRGAEAPALCRWLLRSLSPVLEAFHNRPYRVKLAKRLEDLAERGQLGPMLALANKEDARKKDGLGFQRARALFEQSKREIAWLEEGGLTRPEQIRKGSEQAALLVSSMLSGAALLALTLVMVV